MMVEIVIHTPLWIFGLLAFLLLLGWQQSRNRTVKQYVIFILPAGMLFLSFFGVYSSFGLTLFPLSLWLAGLLSTTFLGLRLFPVANVAYNKDSARFSIPGSWIPLVLMMAIFFTKYAVGVLSALSPAWLKNPAVVYVCSFACGVFSGVFSARALSIWNAAGFDLNREAS